MSRSISLFANYHSGENCVTNYCGLMMKLVYENSPRKFEKLLSSLFPNSNLPVGPTFIQQEKQKNSVPDLTIRQRSFTIYFENKLTDWFHTYQLQNHIDGLMKEPADQTLLVLLCSDFNKHKNELEKLIKENKSKVLICMITYRAFCDCLRDVCTDGFLKDTFESFEEYLDRDVLIEGQKITPLEDWSTRMDVVNCGVFYDYLDKGVYFCPTGDENRAYSHRRARILGAYKDKQVSLLFNIEAVAVVPQNTNDISDVIIQWSNNPSVQDDQIKQEALHHIKTYRSDEHQIRDLQVFLLSDRHETSFIKDSDGGMYASKKYYTIDPNISVKDLAQLLANKKWSEYNDNKIRKLTK